MTKLKFPLWGKNTLTLPVPSTVSGWAVFVFLFSMLLLLPFLGDPVIRTADEGQRSVPAMEMLQHGDWVVPRMNGEQYLKKPPMVYWQVALAYKLFGFTEFAARISIALCGALMAMVTMLWARTFCSMKTAVLAGVICAANAVVVQKSRECQIDVPLTLFIALGLWAWMSALRRLAAAEKGWCLQLVLGGVAMSVAHLYKFPMAYIFAGMAWIGPVVMLRDLSYLKNLKWWSACIVAVLSLIPLAIWCLMVVRSLGWDDAVRIWVMEAELHAVKATPINSGPPWFYVGRLIVCFIPWILWLPVLFLPAFARTQIKSGRGMEWAYLSACVLLSFIILSINTAKETEYMLGLVPPFCILLAMAWEWLSESTRPTQVIAQYYHTIAVSRGVIPFGFVVWILVSVVVFPTLSHIDSRKVDPKGIVAAALEQKEQGVPFAVFDLTATKPYVYFYLGQVCEQINGLGGIQKWWEANPNGVILGRVTAINRRDPEKYQFPKFDRIYETTEKSELVLLKPSKVQ